MKSNLRRDLVKALALASVAGPTMMRTAFAQQDVVKVGILHSLTGTIALAEASVVDAEKLAIDEINAAGGVLGKKIVPVVEDGASDWPTFAEKARKLLGQDKVAAVFGCYTSASRKAVLPVFEQAKGLLYYPTYYEGQEQSPNILYTAHEATQQCVQGCNWLLENRGKTFYLIGSDYIWPRVTNKIARPTIVKGGGSVLGEEYMPLGSTSFGSTINKIKAVKPDIILSTIVGGSNVAFYKQLKAAGVNMKKTTVMAFAVSEEEVSGIGNENVQDVLTCMSYLQSLDNPANKKFVAAFKAKYGQKRVTGDTLACAYTAVYLWKMAVEKAKSFDVDKVIAASANLEFTGPEGLVRFHGTNHHLWKQARIGAFGADGQVNMIYESPLIEPNPFPTI
ncbi:periplasmic binding domain protein [Methyloversatilis sp. RAC08]|uniref:urea ABC transporter substrate-binding protein n=1 Tax=Methyloversatilis sp. RAC08 TaxID=1842540 RepID=UPI00083CBBE7|nr:urea ABC transporter substrate-binding protein [Methyloversatilis sp. RAC08]AOF83117.1 periplasmic binding domain protein [Methyloversatilis sp. RAC08]